MQWNVWGVEKFANIQQLIPGGPLAHVDPAGTLFGWASMAGQLVVRENSVLWDANGPQSVP